MVKYIESKGLSNSQLRTIAAYLAEPAKTTIGNLAANRGVASTLHRPTPRLGRIQISDHEASFLKEIGFSGYIFDHPMVRR